MLKKKRLKKGSKILVCSPVHEIIVELQYPELAVLQYTETDDSRNIHDNLQQERTPLDGLPRDKHAIKN